jgi:hypothetical protein
VVKESASTVYSPADQNLVFSHGVLRPATMCAYAWDEVREHYEPDSSDRWSSGFDGGDKPRSGDNSDNKFEDLADLPDPETFPVGALPPTTRQFVREAAASVGCPVDYIGLSTLAALSAAIGDTRRIVIKKDWTEGSALFGMIVGGPASKKTPAMSLALRPVRERQMALKAEYERQKEEFDSKLRDYEKSKKDGPSELDKPQKPVLGRTYADDTTVERLAVWHRNRKPVSVLDAARHAFMHLALDVLALGVR